MSKEISVHIDLDGQVHLMGTLWIHDRNRRESASFEYSPEWRTSPDSFALEPSLLLGQGTYHTEKALFGAIGDSAPDRWGRNLMKRLEAQTAKREGRSTRRLKESDYLLMVNDFARLGALRFSIKGSDFLAPSDKDIIPPIIALPRLLEASEKFMANKEDFKDLRDLFEPGSSLGGARPKAVVTENDELFIAK
jgi:serine/threonine-protein kinase HipA